MTNDAWDYFKMSTAPTSNNCQKKLTFCQEGHEMKMCKTRDNERGFHCKQCNLYSFQPNQNRFGDNCRIRKVCDKAFMKYRQYGSTIKDSECECDQGYHFENEDQRACVPNRVCPRGFGQGPYGVCEDCAAKKMWSDIEDRNQKCKALRNCEKSNRCTVKTSDGTFDNKCGPVVSDLSNCDSIVYKTDDGNGSALGVGAIAGIVVGAIFVVVVVVGLVLLCCLCRRGKTRRSSRMTKDQLDELLQEIIKRSRKDELYCRKVLTVSQKEVEDRIARQIWTLPQELFRQHPEAHKYETIVEKYKGQQQKYAVNGYLQDWRDWRRDTSEAVEEMMRCLKQTKREDIVYEIVNKLGEDYPTVVDGYGGAHKRSGKPSSFDRFLYFLFPCASYEAKGTKCAYDANETSSKLLEPPTAPETLSLQVGTGPTTPTDAGNMYRSRQTPSAPVLVAESYPWQPPGQHFYDRSDSVPVQASS